MWLQPGPGTPAITAAFLTSDPRALRTSTYSAGPAGRWVAAHETGSWQHGSGPVGSLWQGEEEVTMDLNLSFSS